MERRRLLLVGLSAFLFSLSFPPFPLGSLAFISLIPLWEALIGVDLSSSCRLGYLWGLLTNSLCLFWICWATVWGGIGAILVLSLYGLLYGLLFGLFQRRSRWAALLVTPFLWVSLEYLRSQGQLAFPWLNLSYTQGYSLPFIQIATITGSEGISFWVVSLNLLGFLILHRRRRYSYLFLLTVFLLLPYLWGRSLIHPADQGERIKVSLIQGNIDQKVKWDSRFLDYNIDTYLEMSRMIASQGPDLIIWPETSIPCYLMHRQEYRERVAELSEELRIPLLVGAQDYTYGQNGESRYYNAVFLFRLQTEDIQHYYKIQLVPFSERIPFDQKLPILRRINLGEADFSPGEKHTLFHLDKGHFATLICFEAIFPDLVRKFVKGGADFLVNVTNDGWFGRTTGPFQHCGIAKFRAVENRISMARCANTGISVLYDPYGRAIAQTKLLARGNLIGELPPRGKRTFYTRWGDWFPQLCSAITTLVGIVALLTEFKVKRGRQGVG